jgi:hypothetical protein
MHCDRRRRFSYRAPRRELEWRHKPGAKDQRVQGEKGDVSTFPLPLGPFVPLPLSLQGFVYFPKRLVSYSDFLAVAT